MDRIESKFEDRPRGVLLTGAIFHELKNNDCMFTVRYKTNTMQRFTNIVNKRAHSLIMTVTDNFTINYKTITVFLYTVCHLSLFLIIQ